MGELYVMVIMIIIIIITLTIMYSVLNGFSKYVTEKQQALENLMSTETSVSLSGFNTVGSNYVVSMKISGASPPNNAEAICKYIMGNTQYMQYCNYVISDGMIYVTVPGVLINKGAGNLVISIPTNIGLTLSINLYRGPIEVSVLVPSVIYLSSVSTVQAVVLLTNNSTGWVNATVITNVNGNTIINSTIIPPSSSAAVTIPISITNAGAITVPVTVLVNNYTETVSTIQINVQQPPLGTAITPPTQCQGQNMAFGYVGNATLNNLQVTTYPQGASNPYWGITAIQGSIAGAPNPIYTYAIEEFGAQSYYVITYYYDVSSRNIKVNDYPHVSVYLYPTQFNVNGTVFFLFVITQNNKAIIVYWTSNTGSPSPGSGVGNVAVNNLDTAIQSLFNVNRNNIINVEGGTILTDTWINYILTVSNYIQGNPKYQYVGFGIYLPNPYQYELLFYYNYAFQGVAYWDYVCIGR
ncbi:hypothetical protein GCM10007112_04760 [Vulcanisaeta souniana JCM 11219]|uniref:Uncharacterized protein n=1 Tax=Vulcanisaeta souniana JCM 11219 TaxID=1293586 RepID=A0A830E0L6_9CREN|nr:hypothetical protein GCM10007112_04760 [Vulcanisaeta souniana JCM 11219]